MIRRIRHGREWVRIDPRYLGLELGGLLRRHLRNTPRRPSEMRIRVARAIRLGVRVCQEKGFL